jgi:flagellin
MLSIRTNIASFDAQRNLSSASGSLAKSMEKLSSGFRINRAGDDAAGLAISEKLKAQVGGLMQAARNSGDGISMIQTAEGGLDEIQTMMQRVRELAVQASNDTVGGTERVDINTEVQQLRTEMQNIADRTKFNGAGLLNGSLQTSVAAGSGAKVGSVAGAATSLITSINVDGAKAGTTYALTSAKAGELTATATINGSVVSQTVALADIAKDTSGTISFSQLGLSFNVAATADDTAAALATGLAALTDVTTSAAGSAAILQSGANQGEETTVNFADARINNSTSLSALKTALDAFNTGSTQANASALIGAVDGALDSISSSRGNLGAAQNRLEHTISNLRVSASNLSASNSRIRDVDVAEESAAMARSNVLMQAGVSVLAQANQMPQLALKLLG